jgi:hypothetical protein
LWKRKYEKPLTPEEIELKRDVEEADHDSAERIVRAESRSRISADSVAKELAKAKKIMSDLEAKDAAKVAAHHHEHEAKEKEKAAKKDGAKDGKKDAAAKDAPKKSFIASAKPTFR